MSPPEYGANKEDNELPLSDGLSVSLALAVIAKKNIVITTSTIEITINQIRSITESYMGITTIVLDFSTCPTYSQLAESIIDQGTGTLRPIVMLHNLELASATSKAALHTILSERQLSFKNEVYKAADIFSVISLETFDVERHLYNKGMMLSKQLKELFWFRQIYASESTEHSESPTTTRGKLDSYNQFMERLEILRNKVEEVKMIPEIERYIYDIIVFTRNHRLVSGGLPTYMISDFEAMVKTICVLHGYDFVIPSMVKLVARKILPMKLNIVDEEMESSLQWGSDPKVVRGFVGKWNVNIIVEDILCQISPPI